MSSLHSDHLSSIWNFQKTDKDLWLSFMIKSSFWSTILDDVVFSMNEIILGSSFILLTTDADCTASASDQGMAFSNVKTLEKQAKYEQKHSFQPSWQSKRPQFSFVPAFSVSANSRNYGHDVLGDWSLKNIKKGNFPFTCCSVTILPY